MIYFSEKSATIFNNILILIQYTCFIIFFIVFCIILYFKKYKKERYEWINSMKKHLSWNKIYDEESEQDKRQRIFDSFQEL